MSRVQIVNKLGETVTVDTGDISIDGVESLIRQLQSDLDRKYRERDAKNAAKFNPDMLDAF